MTKDRQYTEIENLIIEFANGNFHRRGRVLAPDSSELHTVIQCLNMLGEELETQYSQEFDQRAAYDSSCDMVFVIDQTGIILNTNQYVEEVFGYSKIEMIGKPINSIISHNQSDFFSTLQSYLEEDSNFSSADCYAMTKGEKNRLFPIFCNAQLTACTIYPHPVFTLLVTDVSKIREKDASLYNALLESEEQARKHYSYLLHEDLAQRIAGMGFIVQILKGYIGDSSEEVTELLDKLADAISGTQEDTRKLSTEIMPKAISHRHLEYALEELQGDLISTGIDASFEFDLEGQQYGSARSWDYSIYRIVKEFYENTVQHANANHVHTSLSVKEKSILLYLEDDGNGFDRNAIEPGNGLLNMQAITQGLNGSFRIESDTNKGTRVYATIPLNVAM